MRYLPRLTLLLIISCPVFSQDDVSRFRYMSILLRDQPPTAQEAKDLYNGVKTLDDFIDEWIASSEHDARMSRYFDDMFGSNPFAFVGPSELELTDNAGTLELGGTVRSSCARNELTTAQIVGDSSGSLDGTYFIVPDSGGTVAIWFDIGNTGTSEPAHGATRAIEVSSLSQNADSDEIATALIFQLNSDGAWDVQGNTASSVAMDAAVGVRASASAGTSGFTMTQVQAGTAGAIEMTLITYVADDSDSLDGTYFTLQDSSGSVAFWIDVDNSGTAEPAHGASRSVEITDIVTDDAAGVVALKIGSAIHADAAFAGHFYSDLLLFNDASSGTRSGQSAGTSGFTVEEGAPGGTNVMVDAWWSDSQVQVCASTVSSSIVMPNGEGSSAYCPTTLGMNGIYNPNCGCGDYMMGCFPTDVMPKIRKAITNEFSIRAVNSYSQDETWKDIYAFDDFYGNRYLYFNYIYQNTIFTAVTEASSADMTRLMSLPIADDTYASVAMPDTGPARAGVATMPGFLRQYNNFRSRVRSLTTVMLCKDVDSSLNTSGISTFVNTDLSAFDLAHGEKAGCAGCHFGMDNIGSTLLGWDANGYWESWNNPSQAGHAFGVNGTGPQFMLDAYIDESGGFHECMAKRAWEDFTGNQWSDLSASSRAKFVGYAQSGPKAMFEGIFKSSEILNMRDTRTVRTQQVVTVSYDFGSDINPILQNSCAGAACHSAGTSLGSSYEYLDNAGNFSNVPRSRLLDGSMPPSSSGLSISDADRDKLILYIDQ